MRFLETDETSFLHSILVGHFLITHETARSDLLINCGLASLLNALSSLGDSPAHFVNELCARLSQAHTLAEPLGQPGLVALLNYLSLPPYDVDLSPEEKRFLDRVKQKCLKWYASQIQTQFPTVDQPLTRESQDVQLQHSVRPQRIIDREQLFINYNLYSLMAEFANQMNYGKAAAFSVAGDLSILRGYIIERMSQELKRRVPGPQILLDISIDADDMAECENIFVKKIMSRNRCNRLIDLFEKHPKMHIMLVIWCYAIPHEQIGIAASHLRKEVEENVLPLLQAQNRCFVLILANVDVEGKPYQLDEFTTLQTPRKFDMTDLLPWMRGSLENLNLELSDIEYCIERLKDQRGDIVRTYHEMEYMVSYLQERYRISL